MERFAKIKAVRSKILNFDSVCRCCGMVNDERCLILEQNDDDVPLKEKISDMIGIAVHRTDQMPQNICIVCMDKIADFYEFRLMALNTEEQTRETLGLPLKPAVPIKKEIYKNPFDRLSDEDNLLIEEVKINPKVRPGPASRKKKALPMPVALAPVAKKSKKDVSCTICVNLHYSYLSDLTDHQVKHHLPSISRYACGSCRETFETLSEQKTHDAWHSKEKILYKCFVCLHTFVKPKDYTKHMTNYNCPEREKQEVLITDIKCFQCRKKFITQSLFEWHGCFLKNKGNCSKCGKYYPKKKPLFIHYVLCNGKFVAPVDPNDVLTIKIEKAEAAKKSKTKTVPMRAVKSTNIIKKELDLEEDDEYLNYEEDIMHDDYDDSYQGASDRSGASTPANVLEPQIELKEKVPPLRIKLEKMSTGYGDKVQDGPSKEIAIDPKIIRNIKKEKTLVVKTAITQQQKNLWQLKIKQEKGASAAATSVLNPMALNKNKPTINHTEQKVYKIPQGLAMKIKREKMDSGYGDKSNGNEEERDEADAEDEEFLNPDIVQIKKEKFDPGYGDKTVLNPVENKPKNMRINPLAYMREKRMADANQSSIDEQVSSPEASSSSTSQPLLIISHVTSIPDEIIESQEDQESENMDTSSPLIETSNAESIEDAANNVQSKSKSVIKPTIQIKREMNNEDIRMDTSYEEESSLSLPGDSLMEGTSMVQIPNEFNKGADEESQDMEAIEEPKHTALQSTLKDLPIMQIENQFNVPAVESDDLVNAVLNGFGNEFNQPVNDNDAELTLEELLNFD
ncbi:unnamed protein product [Diamesa tonsa]